MTMENNYQFINNLKGRIQLQRVYASIYDEKQFKLQFIKKYNSWITDKQDEKSNTNLTNMFGNDALPRIASTPRELGIQ